MNFIEKWILNSLTQGMTPLTDLALSKYREVVRRKDLAEEETRRKEKLRVIRAFQKTFKRRLDINDILESGAHYVFEIDGLRFSAGINTQNKPSFKVYTQCLHCYQGKVFIPVSNLSDLGNKLLHSDWDYACSTCLHAQWERKMTRL